MNLMFLVVKMIRIAKKVAKKIPIKKTKIIKSVMNRKAKTIQAMSSWIT